MESTVVQLTQVLSRIGHFEPGNCVSDYVLSELGLLATESGLSRESAKELWEILLEICSRGIRSGMDGDDPVLSQSAMEFGERLANDGRSLGEGLKIVMTIRRVALEAFRRENKSQQRSAAFTLEGMNHISRSMNLFMVGLNQGHLDAELANEVANRTRQRGQQDAFVLHALTGTAPRADLFMQVDSYGLDRNALYHAFRARAVTDSDTQLLEADLGLELVQDYRAGMTTVLDGDTCGFISRLPTSPSSILVGVSEAVQFTDLPSAFSRATRAFDASHKAGLHGIQSLESLGILASVMTDKDIATVLGETYLLPMNRQEEYGARLLTTMRCYVDNACEFEPTARALSLHVNTVRYRIAKFEEMLGVSLRDTRVFAEVWWALNLPVE
jgi:hypothetical protein